MSKIFNDNNKGDDDKINCTVLFCFTLASFVAKVNGFYLKYIQPSKHSIDNDDEDGEEE